MRIADAQTLHLSRHGYRLMTRPKRQTGDLDAFIGDFGARDSQCASAAVGTETLEQIVNELLEIRGDKDFRDAIERLVHALGMADR